MMYSACKLNKQGDNIQPWHTLFPDLESVCCSMFSSNCCFLTCIEISQEAGQVVWYSHVFRNFPQFAVIHTIKGFDIVYKAEVDVFLELSFFFFYDPPDVGNLISDSSAISNICANIKYLFLFSFWLISLCIIGSRFIHFIGTDSNIFLFMVEFLTPVEKFIFSRKKMSEEKGRMEDQSRIWESWTLSHIGTRTPTNNWKRLQFGEEKVAITTSNRSPHSSDWERQKKRHKGKVR